MEVNRNDQSITYTILNLFWKKVSLDLAPGKDCDFLGSAKMTGVLISSICDFDKLPCHRYPTVAHIVTHSVNLAFGPKSGFKNVGLGPGLWGRLQLWLGYVEGTRRWKILFEQRKQPARHGFRTKPPFFAFAARWGAKVRSPHGEKVRNAILEEFRTLPTKCSGKLSAVSTAKM